MGRVTCTALRSPSNSSALTPPPRLGGRRLFSSVLRHVVSAQRLLEKEQTGLSLLCALQTLRQYYEGVPFAIRCGGAMACAVAGVSTAVGGNAILLTARLHPC